MSMKSIEEKLEELRLSIFLRRPNDGESYEHIINSIFDTLEDIVEYLDESNRTEIN